MLTELESYVQLYLAYENNTLSVSTPNLNASSVYLASALNSPSLLNFTNVSLVQPTAFLALINQISDLNFGGP